MDSFRRLLAFLCSASIGTPIFFYFPNFSIYFETTLKAREQGALLPICVVPLAFLIIFHFNLANKLIVKSNFLPLAWLLIILFYCLLKGVPFLLCLQIVLGLSLIILWPILIKSFGIRCLWAAFISAFMFSVLHLLDTGALYDPLVSLSVYDYPFIYGYSIYQAYVYFPDVILIQASIGLLLLNLESNSLSIQGLIKNFLIILISLFLTFYALSFARGATFVACCLFVCFSFVAPQIRSIYLVGKLKFNVKSFLISVSSFILIYFSFSRFLLGAFSRLTAQSGGSERAPIWSYVLSSLNSPSAFIFGNSDSSVGHNLFLDLLARIGFVMSCVFICLVFVIFKNLAKFFYLFSFGANYLWSPGVLLFFSILLTGNLFNVAFFQPWCIANYLVFVACLHAKLKCSNNSFSSEPASRALVRK